MPVFGNHAPENVARYRMSIPETVPHKPRFPYRTPHARRVRPHVLHVNVGSCPSRILPGLRGRWIRGRCEERGGR